MNLKTMLVVTAVLDLLLGIVLILIPGPATALMGLQIGPVGQSLLRLAGCAILALGLLVYQLRGVTDPAVRRALLRSLFTGNLIATLLALIGQVFMLLNPAIVALVEDKIGSMPKGGLLVVVFVVLLVMTLGYAFLLFGNRAGARQASQQPARP